MRILITLLKAGLGVAIVLVIASKLRFDDVVHTETSGRVEEHSGRNLRLVDGRMVFRVEDGTRKDIALAEGVSLQRRGEASRVRLEDGKTLAVTSVTFSGSYTLTVDDRPVIYPLEMVVLRDGLREDDGWTEKVFDVQEGLGTIFERLSLWRFTLALSLMAGMYLCGIVRWRLLLHAQGIPVSLWHATRYTFIGFFFNNVVPGLTGGDLVKAVMIARDNPGKGPDAVSTVIVDRVLGLLVLAAMASLLLLFNFSRYPTIATWLFLFLGAAAVGIGLFLSRRVRKGLKLDRLMTRLPGSDALKRLDQAFLLYRSCGRTMLWAVILSAFSHAFNVVSVFLMGTDLGVDERAGLEGTPLLTYAVTVPIILIASSVPLLPGGWGIGEVAYAFFFRTVGIRNLGLSVGLSVLTRASMLLWSLVGGVFLFFNRQDAREALSEAGSERLIETPEPSAP